MTLKSVMLTCLVGLLLLFSAPLHAQRVVVTPTPYNVPAGMTVSDILTTTSSAVSTNLVTTPIMLYGLTVDAGLDTSDIVEWVNIFNATSANVSAGTTAAVMSIRLNPSRTGDKNVIMPGSPLALPFSTALSANCTTTRNGATHSTNPCHIIAITK